MLSLKNVCKYYRYGKNKKEIINNININFRDRGMVFILGKSGSGKSTLLNIIAGNLRCDKGEVLVNGKIINDLSSREMDYYRNGVVGYIYQDYNLIDYMNILDNVLLGYTGNDLEYIEVLLKQVEMYDKRYVKVSKLSGGEKQRVAIVRALVNNPDIILADEPTGALDSENGIMVMEILKRISQKKLVIVVSHDKKLALDYGDQIINLKDGKIIDKDDRGNDLKDVDKKKNIAKKKIRKRRILGLAISHLWGKKGRTIMTVLASSLGIVSMMLVLCISSNFNKELDNLEEEVVSVFPISIRNGEYLLDGDNDSLNKSNDKIYIKDEGKYINKISDDYIDYLDSMDINVVYSYDKFIPFISDRYRVVDSKYMRVIPSDKYIDNNYEMVYGRYIENENEILLKIDNNNMINKDIKDYFDFDEEILYGEIINRKIKIIVNDLYYIDGGNYYYINYDYEDIYKRSEIELTIVGIVKEKEDNIGGSFIYYDGSVIDKVIDINKNSMIVNSQISRDDNVLGMDISKEEMLSYLGWNNLPSQIDIYVDNIDDKDRVIKKLDNYNKNNDKVIYEDRMANSIKIVKDFINIISGILVVFSVISIIISLLMIGILTSVRVLEKKKEIGILRSLGASRGDIKRLFNIENMIIGLCSSLVGILILKLLVNPVNMLMNNLISIDNILVIDYINIIIVVIFNMVIVRLAGGIPSKKASKLEITKCIYDR